MPAAAYLCIGGGPVYVAKQQVTLWRKESFTQYLLGGHGV